MFSDFTFICSDGKKIPAHTCILAASTQIMKKMLETPIAESKLHEAKLQDIDGETMTEVLRCIYTMNICINDEELVPKLLYAAEKYNLKQLNNLCVTYMIKNLKVENAIEYFILAERYSVKSLYRKCMSFIHL